MGRYAVGSYRFAACCDAILGVDQGMILCRNATRRRNSGENP